MTYTRSQKEKLILDYLCHDQIGDSIFGETANTSVDITWIPSQDCWQITSHTYLETHSTSEVDYETGVCERAVGYLDDAILDSMIENANLEFDDLEAAE